MLADIGDQDAAGESAPLRRALRASVAPMLSVRAKAMASMRSSSLMLAPANILVGMHITRE
ncbi:hypothetical protein [Azospirillum sp. TSO35-2]|uniref:hypothetical protein n=1 Tax=Azospirillum sp. TSO35-2 TaxID=716796 RepID=UPI0011B78250|nr:hypothetical protein [Azospirillum sp. TSO35-2]